MGAKTVRDRQHKLIEETIKKDRNIKLKTHRVLLLGCGDAGKSTFCRQLKILHSSSGIDEDLPVLACVLKRNCLVSYLDLFRLCESLNVLLPYHIKAFEEEVREATELTEEIAEFIEETWALEFVRKAFKHKSRAANIQILANAPYFFENAKRFAAPDFVPAEKDALYVKLRTSGIKETTFNVNSHRFTIIDVGGQQNERRKWWSLFEGVSLIVYLAALDEYDMTMEEDNETNRFEASLRLFEQITGSQWFQTISCVLFLNKVDAFQRKLRINPMNNYISDAPQNSNLDSSIDFVKKKYTEAYKGASLVVHTTCALDTENCKKVFDALQDAVIQTTLRLNQL